MCNLYSITKGQAAIIALARALRDLTGNLPSMPGVFPDYSAPIVRNAPDGVRELTLGRWGARLSKLLSKLFSHIAWFKKARSGQTQMLGVLCRALGEDVLIADPLHCNGP